MLQMVFSSPSPLPESSTLLLAYVGGDTLARYCDRAALGANEIKVILYGQSLGGGRHGWRDADPLLWRQMRGSIPAAPELTDAMLESTR